MFQPDQPHTPRRTPWSPARDDAAPPRESDVFASVELPQLKGRTFECHQTQSERSQPCQERSTSELDSSRRLSTRLRAKVSELDRSMFALGCLHIGWLSFGVVGVLPVAAAGPSSGPLTFCIILGFVAHGTAKWMTNKTMRSWESVAEELAPFRDEVSRIVDDICESNAIERPRIAISPAREREDKIPGLAPRALARDVLIVPSQLSECSSVRELRGVIAHELAHSRRYYGKYLLFSPVLWVCAEWGVFFAVMDLTLAYSGSFGSRLFAEFSALVGATTAFFGFNSLSALLASSVSRRNEVKTDLLAVSFTNDPEGLIDGLSTLLTEDARLRQQDARAMLLSTHPTLAERIAAIRSVYGSDKGSDFGSSEDQNAPDPR